ncbi:hypothetical protein OQA88_11800 [Cercophora sp. LCS_1]
MISALPDSWVTRITLAMFVATAMNVLLQLLPRKKSEPPLVFHWFPLVGSTITYGKDPVKFLMDCQRKYGDIFTFIMLGRKTTVYLGTAGNDFVLNGKLQELNAADIYGPLCTPTFGSGVVYDCPNSKFMEQKRFMKVGFTQPALESHVRLIEKEVLDFIKSAPELKGQSGILDVPPTMAQITIYTAARTLQGAEVRNKLTKDFADLYHDLDMGFQPINFVIPWAPLPRNVKRDIAQAKMTQVYTDIINDRRMRDMQEDEPDMLWTLMRASYKDGERITNTEIAHLMIALLLAGQHTSSSSSSWVILRLASRPDITEGLHQEQLRNFGRDGGFKPIEHGDLDKMPLMRAVVNETLRLHSSIHSIMRKVTKAMPVSGTDYVIPPGRTLLASPSVLQQHPDYWPRADEWDPHRWEDRNEAEDEDEVVDYGFGAMSKGTKSPYLPFGAGRHRCIGESFAYANLMTIIAVLVREFKFETVNGERTVPPTDYTSLFSMPTRPAKVKWERR